MPAIPYGIPDFWVKYSKTEIVERLTAPKAAVMSLTTLPCQKSWADELQKVQLKREVAGTSKIEGADFTEKEFEDALVESPEDLLTRSQKQAAAAVRTYRWIANLPNDRPVDERLVREIHSRIIQGADDDHCPRGCLRDRDQNVSFGSPRHRGVEGGEACEEAFSDLCRALREDFPAHDPLVQALAFHYHLAAMHPFLDGNGRTARAVEALMLQRVGLRDTLFIAMSNFYYEEKIEYLARLAAVRADNSDLTPFLKFGLRGIEVQCKRLFSEVRTQISKALFRNTMYDLFGRLKSPRKRVIAERQIHMLKLLLKRRRDLNELLSETHSRYNQLKDPLKAQLRDVNQLLHLGAIDYDEKEEDHLEFHARLEWPSEITETEFFERSRKLPKAKTHKFL